MRINALVFTLAAFAALSSNAHADTTANLIKNGDFEATTNGASLELGVDGDTSANRTHLVDWSSTGYNFVFNGNNLDVTGTPALALWGPNSYNGDGPKNGLGASPTGGNVVGADWNYFAGPITQSVSGLVVGQQYALSFSYGAAQQVGFEGVNASNYWAVTLGDTTQQTASLYNASKGFTGWQETTMTFTATSATELLSFMAKGGPDGAPPFMLLDSVAMVSAVPEPATWGMLIGGLGLMGFIARRRRAGSAASL